MTASRPHLLVFARHAAMAFAAVIALCTVVLLAQGHRGFAVLSGSMEPALHVGDLLVSEQIAPADARAGDIVTFSDPENSARLITHRVRVVQQTGATVSFVTKGDANNTTESWKVPATVKIGRMAGAVPKAGYAMHWMRGPLGKLLFVVVPALVLGAGELRRVWRAPQREAEGVASV